MINFLHISFIIVLISFTISVRCADENEALHISRHFPFRTFDHVSMKTFMYPDLVFPTATACPANSDEVDEVAFNEKNSFGKKSLFVRKIYEGEQTAEDVDYHICENPYEMTVLYHNKNVEFQFGFEVFYDKSKYADKGFSDLYRGDYDLITNSKAYINYIKPYFSYLSKIPGLSRVASLPGVNRLLGAQTPLYIDADRKKEMGFLWIDSFRMKYNFTAKRVAQTTYGLSQTTRGIHECENYDLGKEFFNGFDTDMLYKEDNQKRILDGVILPKKSDDNYKEMACESENQCFKKWLSVPEELFHHLAAKPISCSDLLTMPVWKSTIYDALKKLDNFLFTLSIVVGMPVGDLTVHSGVHGVLQLPTDLNKRTKKSITLDGKDIPVPDLIYKLVKYKIKLCEKTEDENNKNDELNKPENSHANAEKDEKTDDLKASIERESANNDDKDNELKSPRVKSSETDEKIRWKLSNCKFVTASIIVVAHNNPYFNYATDKICDDVCEEWGWELIKQRKVSEEVVTSKYIYCCPANDTDVRKKLGINNEQYTKSEIITDHDFSLKSLPLVDIDRHTYKLGKVYNYVVETYNLLFKGDEFQTDVYEEINNLLHEHYLIKSEDLAIIEPQNEGDGPEKSEVQLGNEEGKEDSTKQDSDSSVDE